MKHGIKKVLFILLLMLLAASGFARDSGYIIASDWYNYYFICDNLGVYKGQGMANTLASSWPRTNPTNVHLEVINKVLNRYNTRTGEAYLIYFAQVWEGRAAREWWCVCEYTSNTSYNYWLFRGER
jgi:hypothetical protein